MSNLLYGIGYIEEERGNPPTTVLVVQVGDGQPAKGFTETLDVLGIRHRYDASTGPALVEEVIDEVFEHYHEQ